MAEQEAKLNGMFTTGSAGLGAAARKEALERENGKAPAGQATPPTTTGLISVDKRGIAQIPWFIASLIATIKAKESCNGLSQTVSVYSFDAFYRSSSELFSAY